MAQECVPGDNVVSLRCTITKMLRAQLLIFQSNLFKFLVLFNKFTLKNCCLTSIHNTIKSGNFNFTACLREKVFCLRMWVHCNVRLNTPW